MGHSFSFSISVWLLFVCVLHVSLADVGDTPVKPRTWIVNIDLPPAQRWPLQAMYPVYVKPVKEALALIGKFVPKLLEPEVEDMALWALPHLGEYADEIREGSKVFNISLGQAALLNIIYEVEAGCTSIVAENAHDELFHARNLDFNLAAVLRELVMVVEFQSKGKTLYYGTTYAGYFGLLTGMRPGAFSVSLDQRMSGYVIENLLEALLIHDTYAAAFLIRDTLQHNENFTSAVERLAYTSLVAPAYIIVGGIEKGEGAVITRNRYEADDIWKLDASADQWYLVETNFDHWKPAGDDRRETAVKAMNAIGRTKMDITGLWEVLSTAPVLNSHTTYTTLMSPATGNYTTFVRNM